MAEEGELGDRSRDTDRVGKLLALLQALGVVSMLVSRHVFDIRGRIFFTSYFVICTAGWAVWYSVRRRQMRRPRR